MEDGKEQRKERYEEIRYVKRVAKITECRNVRYRYMEREGMKKGKGMSGKMKV